jgi:HD-like signal output (HDOD) protein/ActR/RegA family two-component response regulator
MSSCAGVRGGCKDLSQYMFRVLFVDDEPNVIQALQRMLHSMRGEWEMTFAVSGQEALSILSKSDFDVVVTDMKMPGMSGAELLVQVASRFPEVARIILSGQVERDSILQLARTTHTFLSKPCDTATLKTAIARSCALGALLNDKGLRRVVATVRSLPSLPALYCEIMQAIQEDRASITEIGDIVSKDMGMSATVLRVANSASFGAPKQICNPTEAISYVGIDNLRSLILSAHVFSEIPQDRINRLSLDRLWEFSSLLATYARRIARFERLDPRQTDCASMAAFLQGVGKLVLAHNMPERYLSTQALSRAKGIPMWQAEIEAFGASNSDVSAYLLSLWGLPPGVIDAVAWLHRPSLYPSESLSTVVIVHVANAFANASLGTAASELEATIDADIVRRVRLTAKIRAWRSVCSCDAGEKSRAA